MIYRTECVCTQCEQFHSYNTHCYPRFFTLQTGHNGMRLCLSDFQVLLKYTNPFVWKFTTVQVRRVFNPLNPELNPICYLLALLAHHFLRVSRIRVKSLTLRLLMSYILYIYIYIYGAPILDVSRSHTTTQIVGSNPTGGMDICLLWVSCVVR